MNAEFERELRELIEANRTRALWSSPPDYYPTTPDAVRRVLERIAARGDLATYKRARVMMAQVE